MNENDTGDGGRGTIRPSPEDLCRVYERCELTRRRSREIVLRALRVQPVRPGW